MTSSRNGLLGKAVFLDWRVSSLTPETRRLLLGFGPELVVVLSCRSDIWHPGGPISACCGGGSSASPSVHEDVSAVAHSRGGLPMMITHTSLNDQGLNAFTPSSVWLFQRSFPFTGAFLKIIWSSNLFEFNLIHNHKTELGLYHLPNPNRDNYCPLTELVLTSRVQQSMLMKLKRFLD